jgi:putative hydrolase of the HAD superfamily
MLKAKFDGSLIGEIGYATAVLQTALEAGVKGEALQFLQDQIMAFRDHPIEMLPNAVDTLILMGRFRRILLTKGHQHEQEEKLARSGVLPLFTEIIIVPQKDASVLRKAIESIGSSCRSAIVIGNSIKFDVIPASEIGSKSVWLNHPENFHGSSGALPAESHEVEGWMHIGMAISSQASPQKICDS